MPRECDIMNAIFGRYDNDVDVMRSFFLKMTSICQSHDAGRRAASSVRFLMHR
jgi:hypothetical protein